MYGIWNGMRKEFQFGITEDSKTKAMKKLREKIGKDANKWRFEVRKLPVTKRIGKESYLIQLDKEGSHEGTN